MNTNTTPTYEVIVGNIGTVYTGTDQHEAMEYFKEYKTQSVTDYGRAGGEEVTLMEDGEPVIEHFGTQHVAAELSCFTDAELNQSYWDAMQYIDIRTKRDAPAYLEEHPVVIPMTVNQMWGLWCKWNDNPDGASTFEQFMGRAVPMFCSDGGIMIQWCDMWLGLEHNSHGEAHS